MGRLLRVWGDHSRSIWPAVLAEVGSMNQGSEFTFYEIIMAEFAAICIALNPIIRYCGIAS